MDISELLSSVSPEDMEKLKKVAASLMQNGNTPAKQTENLPAAAAAAAEQSSGASDSNSQPPAALADAGLISGIAAVGKLMNTDDDRIRFIEALKPLLSEHKRQKADEAEKLLRLMTVLPALKDSGLLNGLI